MRSPIAPPGSGFLWPAWRVSSRGLLKKKPGSAVIDVQVPHSWQLEAEPVRALAFAVHSDPFAALGPQGNANGRVVHIDGLDAAASMLYRDYSRSMGSTRWRPCSIATTAANRASGSRTSMAPARTWRR